MVLVGRRYADRECRVFLDMVTLFPDCKEALYWAERRPLYFRGENGDGILLPVYRQKRPEWEARWNELHKSAG